MAEDRSINRVNSQLAHKMIVVAISAGLVPMMTGSPGTGKSAIVRAVAKEYNLKLIDLRLGQCDPTDLLGFPSVNADRTKAGYVPMDTFPIEGDPIPKGYDGWLLFLDEFNSADRSVQKAAYKLILDRQVGRFNLHKNVAMVCAGNLDTDGAIVEEMSTALGSRLCHFQLETDWKSWMEWATNDKVHHTILSYLTMRKGDLNNFNPNLSGADPTYCCERTWGDMASRLMYKLDIDGPEAIPLMGGTIGMGVGASFIAYCRLSHDVPTVQAIIRNPKEAEVPAKEAAKYFLSGAIASWAEESNMDALVEYIKRLPMEMQVLTFRTISSRNQDLIDLPCMTNWIAENNTELYPS